MTIGKYEVSSLTNEISKVFTSLSQLQVGDKAEVIGLQKGHKGYRQRLLSIGLVPGTIFLITRLAPLGDPIQIKLSNKLSLSLRKREASIVKVIRLP